MELKERLARLRNERGYSLRELRDRIEHATSERLAISYLSELERTGGTPSVDKLARIAAGYEMTLQELIAPVAFNEGPERLAYSEGFLEFVQARQISVEDQEALWRVEFRGERPHSVDDWDLLYLTLSKLTRLNS